MYIFIECISLLCHDSTRFFFIPMMMMMMMMFLSFFLSFLSFVVVLQKYVSYHILPHCGCGSAIFCQKKKEKEKCQPSTTIIKALLPQKCSNIT